MAKEARTLPPYLEEELIQDYGLIKSEHLSRNWFHLVFSKDQETAELVKKLSDKFIFTEPNYIYKSTGVERITISKKDREEKVIPNDPGYINQWYLAHIQAPRGWEIQKGSKNVKIAVLDTGIELDHPDLLENIDAVESKNLLDEKVPPLDDNGHGTAVAGIIGAVGNNGIGVTGLNWETSLLIYKVLDSQGYGSADKIIRGINAAIDAGAYVINMSFGGTGDSQALREAIMDAYEQETVLVAGAGNKGELLYPAKYPLLLAVSGTDERDNHWFYVTEQGEVYEAAYGEEVDVSAPAQDIYTTTRGKEYGYISGTSVSAAVVSGLAGLILAADVNVSRQEVYELIKSEVDPLNTQPHKYIGTGRVNVYKALSTVAEEFVSTIGRIALEGTPTSTPTATPTATPTSTPTSTPTGSPTSSPAPGRGPCGGGGSPSPSASPTASPSGSPGAGSRGCGGNTSPSPGTSPGSGASPRTGGLPHRASCTRDEECASGVCLQGGDSTGRTWGRCF